MLPTREAIEFNQAQVDQLLGYKVESYFITDALTRLGSKVTVKAEGRVEQLYHHHTVLI